MPASASAPRRGRPLKFGRPAKLVTLTLPDDVIKWLSGHDRDLAWAVVKLYEHSLKTSRSRQPKLADLVKLPGQKALILVKPEPFQQLQGVSIIPLADGRGFLALDSGRGVADLELAVIDRMESPSASAAEREALASFRTTLRKWRLDGVQFESRSIVVATRHAPATSRPRQLAPLAGPRTSSAR